MPKGDKKMKGDVKQGRRGTAESKALPQLAPQVQTLFPHGGFMIVFVSRLKVVEELAVCRSLRRTKEKKQNGSALFICTYTAPFLFPTNHRRCFLYPSYAHPPVRGRKMTLLGDALFGVFVCPLALWHFGTLHAPLCAGGLRTSLFHFGDIRMLWFMKGQKKGDGYCFNRFME